MLSVVNRFVHVGLCGKTSVPDRRNWALQILQMREFDFPFSTFRIFQNTLQPPAPFCIDFQMLS